MAFRFHFLYAVCDVGHVLLDGGWQVGKGCLRTRDHKEVRIAGGVDAHDGLGLFVPLLSQRAPVGATDIDRFQGTGVGLEASCQDNDVKLVEVFGRLNAGLRDLLDRLTVFDVNELHVVAVVGLVVTVIQRRALGKQRVSLGRQ